VLPGADADENAFPPRVPGTSLDDCHLRKGGTKATRRAHAAVTIDSMIKRSTGGEMTHHRAGPQRSSDFRHRLIRPAACGCIVSSPVTAG